MTSVRHIPARCSNTQPTPRRNLDPLDPDLLIPIELSQASQGDSVQDLGENEAGEAYDTSIAHTPPSQPCGQIQAQRSDNNSRDSIAHFRTHTPSQREIYTFRTATPSQSEIFSQNKIFSPEPSHNNRFRTNTSSQSEIFSELSNASYSSYTETGTSTDICEEYHHTLPDQQQGNQQCLQLRLFQDHHILPKRNIHPKQQQSTMQAVRQVPVRLLGPPPQSLAI